MCECAACISAKWLTHARSNGSFRRKRCFIFLSSFAVAFVVNRTLIAHFSCFLCPSSFIWLKSWLKCKIHIHTHTLEQKRFLIVPPRRSFLIFSSRSLFSRKDRRFLLVFSFIFRSRSRWFVLFELSCSTPQLFCCIFFVRVSFLSAFSFLPLLLLSFNTLFDINFIFICSRSSFLAFFFAGVVLEAAVAVFSVLFYLRCVCVFFFIISFISSFTVNVLSFWFCTWPGILYTTFFVATNKLQFNVRAC